MASSIFQHKMTQLRVVAYALGGGEAEDRVPKAKRPAATEEEAQRRREVAVGQLQALQGIVAKAKTVGPVHAPAQAPIEVGSPEAALKAALDKLPKPGD